MKYEFYFTEADNCDYRHQVEASSLKQALSLFVEYVLRNSPDITYLYTHYSVYGKGDKASTRKMNNSSKNYFWTFLSIQKKMEDYLAANKVL